MDSIRKYRNKKLPIYQKAGKFSEGIVITPEQKNNILAFMQKHATTTPKISVQTSSSKKPITINAGYTQATAQNINTAQQAARQNKTVEQVVNERDRPLTTAERIGLTLGLGTIAGIIAGPGVIAAAPAVGAGLTANIIPSVAGSSLANLVAAYGVTDFALNRAPQLPRQISRGEYADVVANLGFGALDLMGANMLNPTLFRNIGNVAQQTGKGIIGAYDKVATGNSFIPYAWKMEKSAANTTAPALQNLRNLTDEEARVVNSYLENPYAIKHSPEDSKILESVMKKNYADLSGVNQPITRINKYYVDETQNPKIIGKYNETFSYPENEGRSWSLGVSESSRDYANIGKQRLVIPSRYAKQLEGFHAIDYTDPRLKFTGSRESELFGNVPKGFKVIGKSNEGGFRNIFIKPIKKQGGETGPLPISPKDFTLQYISSPKYRD
jgi:hypothetical protein